MIASAPFCITLPVLYLTAIILYNIFNSGEDRYDLLLKHNLQNDTLCLLRFDIAPQQESGQKMDNPFVMGIAVVRRLPFLITSLPSLLSLLCLLVKYLPFYRPVLLKKSCSVIRKKNAPTTCKIVFAPRLSYISAVAKSSKF